METFSFHDNFKHRTSNIIPAYMKLFIYILAILVVNSTTVIGQLKAQQEVQPRDSTPLLVRKCADFNVTGKGDNAEWNKTEWTDMTKLDTGGKSYIGRFKILYSAKGIYVLFYGDDNKISTAFDKDFDDLFKGDVFEVFFHADVKTPIYFEYEINQLNKELVLLLLRMNGKLQSWIPWRYEGNRRTIKMAHVAGGKKAANEAITSWTAEVFFPNDLLGNIPPVSGTVWNANFYRLDYDSVKMIKWAWGPVKKSFHELDKFRSIKFE